MLLAFFKAVFDGWGVAGAFASEACEGTAGHACAAGAGCAHLFHGADLVACGHVGHGFGDLIDHLELFDEVGDVFDLYACAVGDSAAA